jgi:hypothetical protein
MYQGVCKDPNKVSRCTKLGDLENKERFVAFNEETQRAELYLIRRPAIMSKLRDFSWKK